MAPPRRKPAGEERIPPYSDESELAVLGCVLLDPKDSIPKILELIPLEGSLFYDGRNQAIWEACIDLFDCGMAVDLVTLSAKLREKGQLENVGGVTKLANLSDSAITTNLGDYLQVVREKFTLRQILKTASETTVRVFEEKPSLSILEQAQKQLLRISAEVIGESFVQIGHTLKASMEELRDLADNSRRITGLASGFLDLDHITAGFQPGEMTVIAARPSVGKSAMAMNIAIRVAREIGSVGFFSLEMTSRMLANRLLSSESRVNRRDVISGAARTSDVQKLRDAYLRLRKAPLFVDPTSDLSITQLRTKAMQLHAEKGAVLFLVDYLQLVSPSIHRGHGSRASEIGEVSAGIKAVAKSLNVPVIALAQLNRDMEKEKGRPPRVSDLRESGQIEQDADMVILLHLPPEEEEKRKGSQPCLVNVNVAKNRGGPTGEFEMVFIPVLTQFENAARDVAPADQTELDLPKAPKRKS